jgi:hypothetical protein
MAKFIDNIKRLRAQRGTLYVILVFVVGPFVLLLNAIGDILINVGEWLSEFNPGS